ncbi:RHS repeat-associated core domain-containing protein [Pseudomonas sp. SMSB3]|uniref:RHS repeat-associated core domain-containing protein n=1 Tax=Pseudomonas sp. SMSB3 TaxID=3390196 RepID=UPI003F85F109
MLLVPLAVSRYSAYGYRANATDGVLAFNDERHDPFTTCYHLGNGYRAYNPALMRFQSADRLSPFDQGGLNSYAYCRGDPVNHRDPTGAQSESKPADYVLPALSVLTNMVGLFISGLRFRSLYKQGSAARRTALEPLAPDIPLPTRSDWVLSSISAVSATAGITIGITRMVDPESDWQTWAVAGLTSISLATSAFEAWKLAQHKPWRSSGPQVVLPLSDFRSSPSPPESVRVVRRTS